MFESMAASSSSSDSSLMDGVKYFIQSSFTVGWTRNAAKQPHGDWLDEGVCGGVERIVVLERELASVRAAAKAEDAAATLKTRAASETSDRASERCEDSLALEEKACGPPGTPLEERYPLLPAAATVRWRLGTPGTAVSHGGHCTHCASSAKLEQ